MTQYVIWQVFREHKIEFYIVNRATRRIQSAWRTYLEASVVCGKMNRDQAKGVI